MMAVSETGCTTSRDDTPTACSIFQDISRQDESNYKITNCLETERLPLKSSIGQLLWASLNRGANLDENGAGAPGSPNSTGG